MSYHAQVVTVKANNFYLNQVSVAFEQLLCSYASN